MDSAARLEVEFDRWTDIGLVPRIWLRDDDATSPSPALDRLIGLARRSDAPVLLAVIPAEATQTLFARLSDEPLVTPAVHGWQHRNHRGDGEKPVELTEAPGRPVEAVLAELAEGHRRLHAGFGHELSGILVPPWNRISPAVAARIGEVGFSALSAFGWGSAPGTANALNTHVDLMNWRGGRTGHAADVVDDALATALSEARQRGGAPVGLLSHHLAHDETAWASLDRILARLCRRGIRLHFAEALLAASQP